MLLRVLEGLLVAGKRTEVNHGSLNYNIFSENTAVSGRERKKTYIPLPVFISPDTTKYFTALKSKDWTCSPTNLDTVTPNFQSRLLGRKAGVYVDYCWTGPVSTRAECLQRATKANKMTARDCQLCRSSLFGRSSSISQLNPD
ncbi:hypothetical protein J6590_035763 [Homalodisca vitripennis]|nr:hypothetical protein J6590_035763 [Homalodisca vitripennis]